MKKILSGFISLTIILAVVGVAFALTFNQATISGFGLTMTDPDLQIADSISGSFGSDHIIPLSTITNLRPGDPAIQIPFALLNKNNKKMKLSVNAIQPDTGWDVDVANNIQIAFVPATVTSEDEIDLMNRWWVLYEWTRNWFYIDVELESNQPTGYMMWVRISGNADQISAGKTVSNVQFLLMGNLVE